MKFKTKENSYGPSLPPSPSKTIYFQRDLISGLNYMKGHNGDFEYTGNVDCCPKWVFPLDFVPIVLKVE